MRATAENAKMASLLGINVNAIVFGTFVVASALAGVAGLLVGLSYRAYSPFMGVAIGLKGFAIIVFGGMGNIRGAMVGGLILGTAENPGTGDSTQTRSFVGGRFTLGVQSVLEVQHYCAATQSTNGFGPANNIASLDEVYTIAEFWREAE